MLAYYSPLGDAWQGNNYSDVKGPISKATSKELLTMPKEQTKERLYPRIGIGECEISGHTLKMINTMKLSKSNKID